MNTPLHVEVWGAAGEAAPVVLLHGLTGSARAWGDPLLQALAQDRRVLAVDLPGHGRSRGWGDPGQLNIEAVVEGVVRALDGFEVELADWVGYSMGGRVAVAALVRHPERVRRIVLESTSPGLGSEEQRARRREEDEALARRIEARGIEWFVDYWMGLPFFASQATLGAEVLEAARRGRMRNDPAALAAVLRGMGTGSQPSYWGELASREHPVMVLTGELDSKYCELGDRMVERFPNGEHQSVPGVGHAVHLEAPDDWIPLVTSFLDRS